MFAFLLFDLCRGVIENLYPGVPMHFEESFFTRNKFVLWAGGYAIILGVEVAPVTTV